MSDDRELVRRARRGERDAFDILFRTYGERLRAFASRVAGDSNLGDDLVQEAFLAAFRGISGYRGDAPFFGWMCAIVVRRHRDWLRKHKRTEELDEAQTTEDASNLDLVQAISDLAPSYREAFLLVKIAGLTHVEAAAALRKPVGTVKWLCAEATSKLKLTLTEENNL